MKQDKWNRCEVCGQFIAYKDFIENRAVSVLTTPSAYGTEEAWSTYHLACNEREASNQLDGRRS